MMWITMYHLESVKIKGMNQSQIWTELIKKTKMMPRIKSEIRQVKLVGLGLNLENRVYGELIVP